MTLPTPVTNWRSLGLMTLDPPLQAALECFTEVGYDRASVRQVAQRCGLSVAGLYHHFNSKDSMLSTLIHRSLDEFEQALQAALAEAETDVERFLKFAECLSAYYAQRAQISFLTVRESRALSPESRRPLDRRRAAIVERLADLVTAGVQTGHFKTEDPHTSARLVIAICQSITDWYRPTGPDPLEEVVHFHAQSALRLVGAEPETWN